MVKSTINMIMVIKRGSPSASMWSWTSLGTLRLQPVKVVFVAVVTLITVAKRSCNMTCLLIARSIFKL